MDKGLKGGVLMETIVKGTNKSLVLGYQDLKIKNLEATLFQYKELKKVWKLENVMILDSKLILPLDVKDTEKLTRGLAELNVKVVTPQGHILFMDTIMYKVR